MMHRVIEIVDRVVRHQNRVDLDGLDCVLVVGLLLLASRMRS